VPSSELHPKVSALTIKFPPLNNDDENYVIKYFQETRNINLGSSSLVSEAFLLPSSGISHDYADRQEFWDIMLCDQLKMNPTFQRNILLPPSESKK
jgi:hypothetical protein